MESEWDHENFAEEFSVALDGPEEANFVGLFERFWEADHIQYRGNYAKGFVRTGIHQVYWRNGNLREHGCWRDGYIVGTLQRFREDGSLEEEYYFGDCCETPWHYVQRIFDENQRLRFVFEIVGYDELNRWTCKELAEFSGPDSPEPFSGNVIEGSGVVLDIDETKGAKRL